MEGTDRRRGFGSESAVPRRRKDLPSPLGTVASSVAAGVIDLLGAVGRGLKGAVYFVFGFD